MFKQGTIDSGHIRLIRQPFLSASSLPLWELVPWRAQQDGGREIIVLITVTPIPIKIPIPYEKVFYTLTLGGWS